MVRTSFAHTCPLITPAMTIVGSAIPYETFRSNVPVLPSAGEVVAEPAYA